MVRVLVSQLAYTRKKHPKDYGLGKDRIKDADGEPCADSRKNRDHGSNQQLTTPRLSNQTCSSPQSARHTHSFRCFSTTTMPRIKTTRTKAPPEGFEDIENVRSACKIVFIQLAHINTYLTRFSTTTQRR